MRPQIRVLILSDGRPGHFRQSKGICAALERRCDVVVDWFDIGPVKWRFGKLARSLAGMGALPDALVNLYLGGQLARYRRWSKTKPDLIVSAGGNTLPLNVILARQLNTPNIFSGSVRNLSNDQFSAILHTDTVHEGELKTFVGLKPTPIRSERDHPVRRPPKHLAVLIGGPTSVATTTDKELDYLLAVLSDWKPELTLLNGPRTPANWTSRLVEIASSRRARVRFVDFADASSNSLDVVLATVDAALVTADSASMLTDCVAAQLPTVSLVPAKATYGADADYFQRLQVERKIVPLKIAKMTIESIQEALAACVPQTRNHLEVLAENLDAVIDEVTRKQC